MKKCSRCCDNKPVGSFTKEAANKDGLGRWCKDCRRDYKARMRHTDAYRSERQRKRREAAAEVKASLPARQCGWCGTTIPLTKRSHARWCSQSCSASNQSLKRRLKGAVPFPYLTRQEIIARDKRVCHICETVVVDDRDIHIDHIIPVCLGGGSDAGNVAVAHSLCNMRKGGRLLDTGSKVA